MTALPTTIDLSGFERVSSELSSLSDALPSVRSSFENMEGGLRDTLRTLREFGIAVMGLRDSFSSFTVPDTAKENAGNSDKGSASAAENETKRIIDFQIMDGALVSSVSLDIPGLGEVSRDFNLVEIEQVVSQLERAFPSTAAAAQNLQGIFQKLKGEALGVFDGFVMNATSQLERLATDTIGMLGAAFDQGLGGALNRAGQKFSEVGNAAIGFGQKLSNNVLSSMSTVTSFLSGALTKAIQGASVAFSTLGRVFLANPIGLVVAGIAAAAALIIANWDSVSVWFEQLWGNISQIFDGAIQIISGLLSGDMGAVVEGLKTLWDGFIGFYETIWDGVKGVVTSVVEFIDGIFGTNLTEIVEGFIETIESFFSELPNRILGFFADIGKSIKDTLGSAVRFLGFGSDSEDDKEEETRVMKSPLPRVGEGNRIQRVPDRPRDAGAVVDMGGCCDSILSAIANVSPDITVQNNLNITGDVSKFDVETKTPFGSKRESSFNSALQAAS